MPEGEFNSNFLGLPFAALRSGCVAARCSLGPSPLSAARSGASRHCFPSLSLRPLCGLLDAARCARLWPSDVQGGGEAADLAGKARAGPSRLASPET